MAAVVAEQDKGMEVVAMSRELSTYEAMGGTYTEMDGVFYPNIVVSEEADVWIGKYGLLWIDYIKSNHAERYRHHIRMGTLSASAFELNEEAYEMLEGIVNQYLESISHRIQLLQWKCGSFGNRQNKWRKRSCLATLYASIIRIWRILV